MSDESPGQYRYVRGRTVDPETGRPAGDEQIPVAEVVEPGAEVLAQEAPPSAGPARPARQRGRPLGPVRSLEDLSDDEASAVPRRRLSQKLVWIGSGAVAAITGMVVLGAQGPDLPATPAEPSVHASAPAAPVAPTRGVVAVAPPSASKASQTGATPTAAADGESSASGGAPEPEPQREVEPAAEVAVETTQSGGAAPGSAAAVVAPPAAPEPPVDVPTVRISINATPWALIEIDGEPVGETPLAGVELAVGRHRFVARMPDGSVRERVAHVDTISGAVLFE